MGPPVAADPWTTGIMAGASVATKALEKPSMTSGQNTSSVFDSSGWAVNVGTGASQSTQSDRSSAILGTSQLLRNPLVLVALCLAVYYVTRKK